MSEIEQLKKEWHDERNGWNARLMEQQAEIERLTRERDEYASVALAGLSGLVGTPERGYVKDGGPGLLADDFRRLRLEFDRLADECRRLASGLDPEPGPAVRYDDTDTLATEGP